jgi:hypothetical protein
VNVGSVLFQETREFEFPERKWTILFHANPNTARPYVLMPIGTAEDGFYEWDRDVFLGRNVIGAAPATSAVALWLEGDVLFRVEVQTGQLLGPAAMAPILDEIESLVTH